MLCGELSLEKIFSRLCSSSERLVSPQDKNRAGKDLPISSEDHGENWRTMDPFLGGPGCPRRGQGRPVCSAECLFIAGYEAVSN